MRGKSGGSVDATSLILGGFGTTSTTSPFYFPLTGYGNAELTGTEAGTQTTINKAMTVTRFTARANTNTKSSAVLFGLRDDGVTIASVTITSGSTGTFDSGAIDVDIVSDSECNYIESGATSAGTIVAKACVELKPT